MTLTASQAEWLRVRSYLQVHRHALAVDAAGAYPAERRMAGTPLLTAPEWQPAEPVPLHDIELEFFPSAAPLPAPGGAPLPERPDGTRYRSYSDALRDLAAPAVFENRPTYRLTEADLTKPRLAFTTSWPSLSATMESSPCRVPWKSATAMRMACNCS